mgnify:CR=1 FL=1
MAEMMRLKYTVKLRTDVGQYTSEDTYIGMENVESQTGRYVETDSTYTDGTYCIVKKDDVLFGKLRPYLAKALICDFDGFSTNEFLTFSDFSGDKRFLFYWLLSDGFVKLVDSSTYGTKMPRASWDFIRNTLIPLPELAEQNRIVAYLDRCTAEIDTLLTDLQSQVEMLDRYKRELIAEAVTKGLGKSAAMKNSGVDYIGAIPEAWELLPLFAVATENNVKNTGLACENLLSLSYGKVIRKDIDTNFGLLPASFEGYQIVQPSYTVLRFTDLQNDKRSLRSGYVTETGIITSAYMGLIPGERLDGKYFNYLLHAYDLLKVYYGMGGGLRQTLKFSDVKRLPVLIPTIPEQKAIVAYLDAKTAKIEGLIADITAQIEKLKQYRQIVIHDSVTGKIKVTEG